MPSAIHTTIDGETLHLAELKELPGRVVDIIVQPVDAAVDGRGWPPAYFDSTFGSIHDETFMRPPQGELAPAVDFH